MYYYKMRIQQLELQKLENAHKMKADNMPVELITKYTGLTAEEIDVL